MTIETIIVLIATFVVILLCFWDYRPKKVKETPVQQPTKTTSKIPAALKLTTLSHIPTVSKPNKKVEYRSVDQVLFINQLSDPLNPLNPLSPLNFTSYESSNSDQKSSDGPSNTGPSPSYEAPSYDPPSYDSGGGGYDGGSSGSND